ncbi:MAG TPA: PPC domain-containing protein [Pirellulales bacterium]|nr:PPC domain-containing protein [Pirellulales bacterium]
MRFFVSIAIIAASAAVHAAPPTANYLFPAGGQRGQTVELTVSGNFANWPAKCWTSRPGVTVSAAKDKGKFSAVIAADAAPGLVWLRFYDAEGAAAPLPFFVGTLAETNEQEPNDSPQNPQTLSAPATVVNGRLQARGDVDVFSVGLAQGQTLVAALEAHRTLGSPVDAVLQIVSSQGAVLAQNDDEREIDPLLTFVAPATGNHLVRVFGFPAAADTQIALSGADAYVYRLTITAGGYLDAAFPLAVVKDGPTTVELSGWNLPEAAMKLTLSPAADQNEIELFEPSLAESLTLPVEPHAVAVEAEPNPLDKPQAAALPFTVTGRISERTDRDAFRFAAAKGEVLRFAIESNSLGYPLDAVLELFNASSESPLVRVDDAGKQPDAELTYTAPADGEYRIVVSDLYRHFGPRFVYRLRAVRLAPDFRLTADAHAFTLAAGKPLEIPLKIERLQNFKGEIAFKIDGLPPGVSLAPAKSLPEGDSAKVVKLSLSGGQAAFSGPIRILGEAAGQAGAIAREARTTLPNRTATTAQIWLTLVPAGK